MKKSFENLELYSSKIVSIDSKLEGVSDNSNLRFRYVNIGDTVEYYKLGRGQNKFAKVQSIQREVDFTSNCKYFSNCGGCKAQHLDYEKQFLYKTKDYFENFKNKFGIELELFPALEHFHYRNRMDFAVFPEKIGLRQMNNFRHIIDIDECKIQSNWANAELKVLREFLNIHFPNIAYNRKTETGFLKYLTLRTNLDSSDTICIFTFIADFKNTELQKELAEKIINYSISKNIVFCYSRKNSENSCDGESETIKGENFYIESFLEKKFIVPYNSFSQPNLNGFLPIVNFIKNIFEQEKSFSNLIDLFCGNGFFSFLFAEYFEKIFGFDWVENSISIAKENLKSFITAKDFQFHKIDLISKSSNLLDEEFQNEKSIMILDPPRNGIGKNMIDKTLNSKLKCLVYISCNPESQIEDLSFLTQKYEIISGLLTDPYPQTSHVESAIFLRKRN